MKYLVIIAVVLAGAFFYPQIAESVGGPCQALEAKFINEIRSTNSNISQVAGLVSMISDGEMGGIIANREYPNLPTPLGCVVGYYNFDPSDFRR